MNEPSVDSKRIMIQIVDELLQITLHCLGLHIPVELKHRLHQDTICNSQNSPQIA